MHIRDELVQLALRWERTYGVMPRITDAIGEYDAARLIGMPDTEYSEFMRSSKRTAVSRGFDFKHATLRYQVKSHRPSGKPGSVITNAGKASNYDWDRLIWIRYDSTFVIQEAWIWDRESYQQRFSSKARTTPEDMRCGTQLWPEPPAD